MRALSEFSGWLCSFLDKWLLTFPSQKGALPPSEASPKVMGKKRKAELFQSISREVGRLPPADGQGEAASGARNGFRPPLSQANAYGVETCACPNIQRVPLVSVRWRRAAPSTPHQPWGGPVQVLPVAEPSPCLFVPSFPRRPLQSPLGCTSVNPSKSTMFIATQDDA